MKYLWLEAGDGEMGRWGDGEIGGHLRRGEAFGQEMGHRVEEMDGECLARVPQRSNWIRRQRSEVRRQSNARSGPGVI